MIQKKKKKWIYENNSYKNKLNLGEGLTYLMSLFDIWF